MAEDHLPLLENASLRQELIEPVIGVVDHGRRSGKIPMGPCVREHMHGKSHGLQTFPLSQIHRADKKVSVGAADQAVFVLIGPGSLYVRMEITGEKVK